MSMNYTTFGSSFLDAAYQFICATERKFNGLDLYPRDVRDGAITIGAGINISGGKPTNKFAVYRALGIVVRLDGTFDETLGTPTQRAVEQGYVTRLNAALAGVTGSNINDRIAQLHQIMTQRAADNRLNGYADNRKAYFVFDTGSTGEQQIRQSFNEAAVAYEKDLQDALNAYDPGITADPNFANSKEHGALLSVIWNGGSGAIKTELKQALSSGNRAEAWFVIRYDNNKRGWREINGNLPVNSQLGAGLAKRRFYEAEVFGLYSGTSDPAQRLNEAKDAYRTLQLHREMILKYEAKYGVNPDGTPGERNMIAEANSDFRLTGEAAVDTINQSVAPACTQILADLANNGNADIRAAYVAWANAPGNYLSTFNVTNLYLDPGRVDARQQIDPDNTANLDARRYQSGVEIASNDILIGDGTTIGVGGDILLGGKGDDLLIGGSGNDYLWGGQGNDFMAGGAGNDYYIMNSGDGTDVIEDKQGINRVVFNGKAVKSFSYDSGTLTFRSLDGAFTAVMQDGDFIVTDVATGDQVILNQNFQEGDFGIDFVDALTDPTIARTIVGDLSPTDPNSPTYDDLGNVVTDPAQPAPGRADYLQDSTGNDDIRGLGGTDIIDAWRGGDDKLDGGTGDDIVSGRDGNDIVIGGEGMDLLRGDAGRDRLYAGTEVTVEAALTAPDAPASGLKGDFIDGGDGDDVLVGDVGNDALNGGDGADIIVGGAGDDNIKGDLTTSMVAMDWSVTRTVSVDANGTTLYKTDYSNVSFTPPTVGGADAIYAGAGADWVNGQWGDDYIDGGSGNDVLFGDEGHDIILGGTGDDVLTGDNASVAAADQGDDYLDGGDGNDTLNGDGGSDVLFGGIGSDRLYGDSNETLTGNDYLDGEEGDDYLWGGGGNDDLRGGDGIDTLHGGAGDDYLDGGLGNDTLAGMAGVDVLYGGDGADFLQGDSGTGVDEGNDYLDGEAGDDVLLGEGGDDILVGGTGADELQGGAGQDELHGGEGMDTLFGGADGDMLFGDEGMDTLDGGDGDDTLDGGLDNDQLAGGAGNDYLDGGDGDNVIDAGEGNDTAYGGTGIDRIAGRAGDDYLNGGDGNDELQGEDGNDIVEGDLGDDMLFGQAGADTLSGGDGADQLVGGTENDVLYGDAGNDLLWGDAGDDVLAGGAGNDTLQGGEGNDVYVLSHGDGQDIVYENDATAGNIDRVQLGADVDADEVTVMRAPLTYNLQVQIDGTGDTLTFVNHYFDPAYQVEEIRFADGTVWTPATMPTLVQGTWDNDWLSGTAGADIFKSGAGNDVMEGGAGNDSYRYFRGDGADFISDVDATAGNTDKIVFGADIATTDVRVSRSGNNLLLTLNAMDSVLVSNYFVNDGASPSSVEQIKFLNDGTVWNVETVKQMALTGSSGNDVLTGYATDDQLLGLAGDDTLQGGSGNDTLDGGAGNDNLQGGAGNDVYVFSRGGGQDTVSDGDTTAGNIDTIQFAADIAPADVKLRRTSFNNLEISVVGDTTLINVPFQFDANGSSAGGIERIQFLADGSFWDGAMIVSMVSAATEGNDALYGFDSQNDALSGLGGNDDLHGGAGNDTLNGGAGDDTLYGGAGSDTYVVGLNAGADVVEENPGGLSSDVDRLVFVDGINYADAVFARAGNDLLISSAAKGFNVRLVNQFGADSNANGVEQVAFADGTTLDRVALGLKVGVGTAGNDVLDGSETNELMDGLGGDDLIYGRGGDDTLTGGSGSGYDSLYGGAGSDTYIFGVGDWYDTVDETQGGLSTDLDRLVFSDGITYADVVFGWDLYGNDMLIDSNAKGIHLRIVNQFGMDSDANGVEEVAFADGTTLDRAALLSIVTTPSEGANVLYGSASNDFIDGLGGNDRIYGYDGNDTLRGGTGSDMLYGGNGNDTYIIQYGDGYADIVEDGSSDPLVSGVDTVSFGAGFLPYRVEIFNYHRGDSNLVLREIYGWGTVTLVDYFADGDIENIEFSDGTVWTQASIANQLTIYGTSSADVFYGNNSADVIWGQEGNDFISGNGGDDTIRGGAGSDTLYGGAGDDLLIGGGESFNVDIYADYMAGGTGNDTYWVENSTDVVTEYSTEGIDTVRSSISYTLGANVENLALTLAALDGSVALDGTGNELSNVLVGNDAKNTLIGNAGNDTLDGGLGADTLRGGVGDDAYVVDDSRDSVIENLNEGMDSVQSSVSHTLAANVENLTLTGTSAINGTDNGLNNLLIGNSAVNTLSGGVGNDILQGGAGDDVVKDSAGNNLLDAGAGSDVLTGASGKEMFIGSAGNDTITTGTGADIIAFNRGDGQDIVVASTGTDNTISLGGGIGYANLAMKKSGSDLILDTGNSEQITLQNWYKGSTNHSVLNLQVVLDNTSYNSASADTLINHRVQTFNFTTLVNSFDQALAANPTLTSWSVTNALLTAHLSGSDSAALGGDLAYQYNLNGSLTGMGLASAQTVINDANFGTTAQTLRPSSELQTGATRLA